MSFQAAGTFLKFLFCTGLSSILSVVGLGIFYSFTIILMWPLEEEEVSRSAPSTETPGSQQNWALQYNVRQQSLTYRETIL